MGIPRDTTMLKPDSQKFLIAMAKARVEPVELAERAELSKNIVYSMRRGFYTKPKYLGKAAEALGVEVEDLIEDKKEAKTESNGE